jgi:hypothetical protein
VLLRIGPLHIEALTVRLRPSKIVLLKIIAARGRNTGQFFPHSHQFAMLCSIPYRGGE